jgi:maleylacetoacetate isomerase/maleylpyruvate isomerase
LIRPDTAFSFGETLTLADLGLIGQMVNARRWGLDLTPFARLTDIDARAREIDAVARALPEAQPDAN